MGHGDRADRRVRGRLLLVANPRAGARSALAVAEAQRATLERGGWSVETRPTERPGHAIEIAREADHDAIVAVGGDGTLHEVANGLAARPLDGRPPLGVVPAGSGNSLCADLGIDSPDRAAERIAGGARRPIDLVRLELGERTLWSINVVGWGAVCRINRRAERMRWAVGLRYTLASVVELFQPRLGHADATVDGDPPDDWLFGTASVTAHTGKAMKIAPRAVLDDGLVDVVRVRRGSRLALAQLLSRVFDGSHVDSPLVRYEQASALELGFARESELLVDGELIRARSARLVVEPRALVLLGAPASRAPA